MPDPTPSPVQLVDKFGVVHEFQSPEAAEDAQLTLTNMGLRAASTKDVRAHDARKEQNTVAGAAGAFGEGLASGAFDAATAVPRLVTAGASAIAGTADPLARVSGRQFMEDLHSVYSEIAQGESAEAAARAYKESSTARAEANSLASGTGTVVGQAIGSAGLTAGAGKVGGLAAETLGGGAAARIAGAGITGAIEGAPLNLTAAQEQAYMQDRQLTGEQALAAIGTGVLVGGATAAGVKGLGEVFGGLKSRGTSLFGDSAEAEPPGAAAVSDEKAVQRVLRTSDDHINAIGEQTLGEAPKPGFAENVREAIGGKNLEQVKSEVHAKATADLAESINKSAATVEDLAQKVDNKAWKLEQVEKHADTFAPDALEQTRARSASVRQDIADTIEGLGKDAPKSLKGLKARLDAADLTIQGTESAAKANIAFDQVRRDLATTSKAFGESFKRASNVDERSLYEAMSNQIGKHYDDAWKFLMDKSTWGEQGIAQEAVNNARAQLIQAQKYAMPHLAAEVGTEYQGLGRVTPVMEAHEGKLLSTVQKMGSTEGAFAERRVNQYIGATKNFAEAMQKYGLADSEKAAISAVQKHAAALEKTFAETTEKVGALNQAQSFVAATKAGSGAVGGGLLGSVLGGPAGAAAGVALGAVTNPAKFLSQRIALEQFAAKTSGGVTKTLDNLFAGIRTAAQATKATAPKAAPQFSRAVPTALELFQGKHATPEMAYQARTQEILAAEQNYGQRIRDNAGNAFGGVGATDPHAIGAAVVAATNAIKLLKDSLPSTPYNPDSLTPLASKRVPSRADIAQFAQLWAAVSKPMDVLTQIPKGTVTIEQVQAIRQTYPSLYGWMQKETMTRLRKLDEDGVEVPIQQRLILDTLLDLGGAGEPTFAPAFGAKYGQLMGDMTQANKPQPRPGASSLGIGKRLSTETSSMIGGQS